MTRLTLLCLTAILTLALSTGCVQRKLTVTSEPTGALIYMNNQEIGRTPLQTDFTYYGKYDVQVRKDGYETLSKAQKIRAPWWQVPPIDLFAEFMPWHPTDQQTLHYTLTPLQVDKVSTTALLEHASGLQKQLESSRIPPATTQSTTTQSSK